MFKILITLFLSLVTLRSFAAADADGFIKGSECRALLTPSIQSFNQAQVPNSLNEKGKSLEADINNITAISDNERVLETACKSVHANITAFLTEVSNANRTSGSGQGFTQADKDMLVTYQRATDDCRAQSTTIMDVCITKKLEEFCNKPDKSRAQCVSEHKAAFDKGLSANDPTAKNIRNTIEAGNSNVAAVAAAENSRNGNGDSNGNGSGSGSGVKINSPITFSEPSNPPLRKSKTNKTYAQHKSSPSEFGNSQAYSGSTVLQLCEGEASVPWPQAISKPASENWKGSMDEFFTSTIAKFNEKFTSPKPQTEYEQFFKDVKGEIESRFQTYVQCQALSTMMINSDFSDSEVENANSKGKFVKNSVTKPELKCETEYHDSQDFYACVKVLNAYDALDIAGKGMQVYQQVDNGMKLSDRQMDLQKKTMTGGTIDTTDVLQQQKQTVKDAAGYATQRAVLDSAKVATLFGMLKQMPSRDDLLNNCNSEKIISDIQTEFKRRITDLNAALNLPKEAFSATFTNYPTYSSVLAGDVSPILKLADGENPSIVCNKAFASSGARGGGAVNLLSNQSIKEQMKGEMVKAGVDAASNMAKAALLNKQAGEIDDVINSIKSFEPPPLPEQQMTDMQILECQANPQAENCGTINGRGNVGFTGNGINVGNGQFATSDGQGIDLGNTDGTTANSATSKTDRTGMARKLGGATADAPGDGGILNPVAAAEIKKGGGNPGGGGGAAGASAPGAAGGGGGKSGAGGGSSAASGQGLAKMKYSGSSSGSLSWSGGGGLARKPAAKVDNPFANLLGKGGGKNGVLDGFRGPASGIGKKEDGLFNMISNRYSQVANDKERLIQYEIKK